MTTLNIIKPATVVKDVTTPKGTRDASPTISLVGGVVSAFDGISPVITVRVTNPERDVGRLLRAAEELLPIHREVPGMVVLDDEDRVQGVILRADLEKAVLQMQRGEYGALAKGLGLRAFPRSPDGDLVAPFVYWQCPQCKHTSVPRIGHEDDPPSLCRLHEPPAQMERRVHGGK